MTRILARTPASLTDATFDISRLVGLLRLCSKGATRAVGDELEGRMLLKVAVPRSSKMVETN